jgi:D-alanyl-D-alanine carboxypeptidase
MSSGPGGSVAGGPRRLPAAWLGAFIIALTGLFAWHPALARHGHGEMQQAAESGPVFAWILLDAETGQVLSERNADVLTYPASLTKMMTLYLTFEALNQGRVRLDQRLPVSAEAAGHAPSKLGLTAGDSVPLRELIFGIVTRSANDAAAVIGEGLAGSEANFARYMTWKARQLGMNHTWYQNASGLPDPAQRTTARDVARLALALYHQFPREYRYFSMREFDFRGDVVRSHNHLLDWYPGADGIKTGFVNASGFNLAASAVRDGHRLIGVIMGGHSARGRDRQMASLLDQGFAVLAATRPASPQAQAPTAVAAALPAMPPPSPSPVAAPVAAGQAAGLVGRVANAALHHLAPVAKAEAAPVAREAPAAGEDWAIQLGAFRDEAAAGRAARQVAGLAVARGKPSQILSPAARQGDRLYRARLLRFTAKGAQAACVELRRRGRDCTVVRSGAVRVASH